MKLKMKRTMLTRGMDFNQLIPAGIKTIIFNHETKSKHIRKYIDVSEKHDGSIIAWKKGESFIISTQNDDVTIMANKDCTDYSR